MRKHPAAYQIYVTEALLQLLQQYCILWLRRITIFVRKCTFLQKPMKRLRHIGAAIFQPNSCRRMRNSIFYTGNGCLLIANIHNACIAQAGSKCSSHMILTSQIGINKYVT